MARIRTNFLNGTIDGILASGGTSLSSTQLSRFPEIIAPNYAVIILDPTGTPEVVYVTAHEVSATTATIVRAQEGTSAVEHADGTSWIHAATSADFPNSVDDLWVGSGYDEEFNRTNSPISLPTGWSWVNQGSATYTEKHGAGILYTPALVGNDTKIINRGIPSESTWTATFKADVSAFGYNYAAAGVVLRDSVSGKFVWFSLSWGSLNLPSMVLYHMTSPTALAATDTEIRVMVPPRYWRVVKHSATSYDFEWSVDGISWVVFKENYNPQTFLGTPPTHIGFAIESNNATYPISASIDWFRVDELTAPSAPLGGYAAWWDASDTTTITDAGAGKVSAWADKSGNGWTAFQDTDADRPITGTRTINSLNTLDFDGTSDHLDTLFSASDRTATMFVVAEIDTDSHHNTMFGSNSNGGHNFTVTNGSFTRRLKMSKQNVSDPLFSTLSVALSTPFIAAVKMNDTQVKIWKELTSESATNSTTFDAARTTLIGAGFPGENFDGKIGEIIFYDIELTDSQVEENIAYLAAKWGIS